MTYGDCSHGSDLECDGLWAEGPLVRVFEDDVRDVGHGRGEKGGEWGAISRYRTGKGKNRLLAVAVMSNEEELWGVHKRKGCAAQLKAADRCRPHLSLRLVLVGEFATEETERRHEECRV